MPGGHEITVLERDQIPGGRNGRWEGEGFSFEMEKYFKNFEMPEPVKAERILELNVAHPAVKAMEALMATDRDKAALYAKILYDQANLIAGLPLEDPGAYTDMVAQLMQ